MSLPMFLVKTSGQPAKPVKSHIQPETPHLIFGDAKEQGFRYLQTVGKYP